MRGQQYLALVLFAILTVAAGCSALGLGTADANTDPVRPLQRAGRVQCLCAGGAGSAEPGESNVGALGRGAPTDFRDRYLFEIPQIAPAGGQIIVFATPAQLQAWQDYIAAAARQLGTRRDVIYVYVKANIMLQLNANLTLRSQCLPRTRSRGCNSSRCI